MHVECRYNKYIKNLVRGVRRPEVSLSVNLGVDVECNYDTLASGVLSSVCVRDRVSVQYFEDLFVIC